MILYNAKSEGLSLRVTKFDDDLNVESSYLVTEANCECPQGHKPTCRHRKMWQALLSIADTEDFYCFDNRLYYGAEGSQGHARPPGATARGSEVTAPALPARDGVLQPTIATCIEIKPDQDIATEFAKLIEHSKTQAQPDQPQRLRRRV